MLYLIVVTALAVVLIFFVLPILLARPLVISPAQIDLRSVRQPIPQIVRNASVAYGLGLASLLPLVNFGIEGEVWPAVAYIMLLALGLLFAYSLRRPLLRFINDSFVADRSTTLNGFIASCYGDDPRLRAFAAVLSIVAGCGLIVASMILLEIVLQPVLPSSGKTLELFIALIFLLVLICTIFAGQLGIILVTQLQLGLTYFGLFGSTLFLLYLRVSAIGALPARGVAAFVGVAIICCTVHWRKRGRFVDTSPVGSFTPGAGTFRGGQYSGQRQLSRFAKILNAAIGVQTITLIVLAAVLVFMSFVVEGAPSLERQALEALPIETSLSPMTLISLGLLGLLRPLMDVVNWDRMAAFVVTSRSGHLNEGEWRAAFRKFAIDCASELPLMGSFIFLFGAIAALSIPTSFDPGQLVITNLLAPDNSIAILALSLFVFSLLSLAVTIMGSLLSASLEVISYDIWPSMRSRPKSASQDPADAETRHSGLIGAIVIAVSVLAVFFLSESAFNDHFGLWRLLAVIFAVGSLQIVAAPLILPSLLARGSRLTAISPRAALFVLCFGAAIGMSLSIVGIVIGYAPACSWAMPGALAAATCSFVVAAFWKL
jgi:hypothetical protein